MEAQTATQLAPTPHTSTTITTQDILAQMSSSLQCHHHLSLFRPGRELQSEQPWPLDRLEASRTQEKRVAASSCTSD